MSVDENVQSVDENVQTIGADPTVPGPPSRSWVPWLLLALGLAGGYILGQGGEIEPTPTTTTADEPLVVPTPDTFEEQPTSTVTTVTTVTSSTRAQSTPPGAQVPGFSEDIFAVAVVRLVNGQQRFLGFFDWDNEAAQPRIREPDRPFDTAAYADNWSWGIAREGVLYAGRGDQPIPAVTGVDIAAFHEDGPPRIAYIAVTPQPHTERWLYTASLASVGGLQSDTPVFELTGDLELPEDTLLAFNDNVIVISVLTDCDTDRCRPSLAVIDRATSTVTTAEGYIPLRLTADWIVTSQGVLLDVNLEPIEIPIVGQLLDALVSPNGVFAALLIQRDQTRWLSVVARSDFSVIGELAVSDPRLATWSSDGEFIIMEASTAERSTLWFYSIITGLLEVLSIDTLIVDASVG